MPKITHARISKASVDKLRPGEMLRDSDLTGFGVRRQSGAPVYFLQKRLNGTSRWFTIGTHGSPWTPELARREAMRLMGVVAEGFDPLLQRQEQRDKPTVREAADQFMTSHGLKLKARTRDEYQRLMTLHICPALGSHSVADIRKADMARFHASMAKTPSGANFALAVLSKFMRWCEDMGYRTEQTNPCRGLTKYRMTKRERFLSREEFARLGDVLREAEINESASLYAVAAIRLLILTGARLNEILTLQWKHVDFERRLLLLPNSKTGQKSIRLSDRALDVLAKLPRIKGNPFVIVGNVDGSHLVNLQKPWRHLRELAGLDDVRIHDLRHSFASVAAATGASLPMIGALLGHSQPQTTARYAHLANDPLHRLNQEIGDVIADAMAVKG